MRASFFILLLSLILFKSCSLLELRGDIPAYISIEKLEFSHKEDQGPTNHNINYVEVYFENKSIGFYEIPFKLAVIPTMEVSKLTILPAIQENVALTAITAYPMMTPYIVEQKFEENKEYNIEPVFAYSEGTKFVFTETFESNHIFTSNLDTFPSSLEITKDMVSQGQGSGIMKVKGEEMIRVSTLFSSSELGKGGQVFAELEYKGSLLFNVGIIGNTGAEVEFDSGVALKEREDWKKVYLNLTLPIVKMKKEEIRMYLEVKANGGEGEVYLDNIKLMYN